MPESEPHLAIQFLDLHHRQVHDHISEHMGGSKGTAVMEGMDTRPSHATMCDLPTLSTIDNNPAATSSKDTCSKDICSKDTCSEDTRSKDTCSSNTCAKDNSSRKQRRARGMQKGLISPTTMEMEDADSKTLLNFGHLLNLYQSSPTSPLLTCPWSTCTFVTQGVGIEEGRPVGAEPYIAIQLLRFHVEYEHAETDLEFLSFLLLEKLLCALPRLPPSIQPSPHTAPGTITGQQEGAKVKVGQQSKTVTTKSTNLSVEKEGKGGISLHCQHCVFVTRQLKPSKAHQRLSSHQNSHHTKPATSSSPSEEHCIQHVPPSSPCQEDAKTSPPCTSQEDAVLAPPSSAGQEDTCQPVLPHTHLMVEPSSPHQGDAIQAPPSFPGPEDHSQPVPIPSPHQEEPHSMPDTHSSPSQEIPCESASSLLNFLTWEEVHGQPVLPSLPEIPAVTAPGSSTTTRNQLCITTARSPLCSIIPQNPLCSATPG